MSTYSIALYIFHPRSLRVRTPWAVAQLLHDEPGQCPGATELREPPGSLDSSETTFSADVDALSINCSLYMYIKQCYMYILYFY
jgi:hypothetical protein